MRRAWDAFRLAVAFLTLVPVRVSEQVTTEANLAASRYAYPLVGALIGLLLAALSEGLRALRLSGNGSALALLAAAVLVTGGLHLDGVADLFDGLFLPGGPVRRLAVMRDPHVGSYGTTALVLVLLGKFVALSALPDGRRSLGILGACVAGRCLILVSAGLATYARPEGTGRILVQAMRPVDALLGLLILMAAGYALSGGPGLRAGLGSVTAAGLLTWLARRRLGGITGDVLGAVVEMGEMVYLLSLG
jgi:adenosylcobinamide-GDP ribazoletransferase